MYEKVVDGHQVMADGVTLWVNNPEGTCVARWGSRHVEVHAGVDVQLAGGGECLDCFDRTDSLSADWDRFTASLMRHYRVALSDTWRHELTPTAMSVRR